MREATAGEFRYLFTPLRVGGLTLKNRIFSTAHAEAMAADGKPGPRLRAYHEAKRGAASPSRSSAARDAAVLVHLGAAPSGPRAHP